MALSDRLVIPPSCIHPFRRFPQVEHEVLSGDRKLQTASVIKASQQLEGEVSGERDLFLYKRIQGNDT